MLRLEEGTAVYLCLQATDMRCGFDRLAEIVRQRTERSALYGGLFVFFSRCRRRVKILYWDKDGYALWYKRLETGTFRVELKDGVERLSGVDLQLLLEGLELSRIILRSNVKNGMYT